VDPWVGSTVWLSAWPLARSFELFVYWTLPLTVTVVHVVTALPRFVMAAVPMPVRVAGSVELKSVGKKM
jgi:hypothetical protein